MTRAVPVSLILLVFPPLPAVADPDIGDLLAHRVFAYSGGLSIEPVTGEIAGDIEVHTRIAGPGHESLFFVAPLPVSAASDAAGSPLPFEQFSSGASTYTVVTLPSPLEDGAEVVVRLAFGGVPSCQPKGLFPYKPCGFGQVSWLDLSCALPCSPAFDFATIDILVDMPAGLSLAGSGRMVSVAPSAKPGLETHHIVQDVQSLSHGLVVGKFEIAGLKLDTVTFKTYTQADPAVQDALGARVTDVAGCLAFFGGRFGPLPFHDLAIAETSNDVGAAFSLAGLIGLPPGIWTGAGGGTLHPPDLAFVVLPHEIAHQWFPAALKPSPISGPWMSEGLAEFAALEYLRATVGADRVRDLQRRYSASYRHLVTPGQDQPVGSAVVPASVEPGMYYHVAYEKGAVVFATLREVVGAWAFDEAMAGLFADKGGKDEFVDAGMLRGYLEAASGMDLEGLFDAWVWSRGFPILGVGVSPDLHAKGPFPLSVRITRESSVPGVVFSMPVRLALMTEAGPRELVVNIDKDDQTLTFNLDARFIGLKIDPGETFVKRVAPAVAGDTDLSGDIDGIDLVAVALAQGEAAGSDGFRDECDVDGSGTIDATDLAVVMEGFGGLLTD